VFRRSLDAETIAAVPHPPEPRPAQRPSLVASPEPTVVAVRRDPAAGPTPRLGPARGAAGD
jgi:hypothetical protein